MSTLATPMPATAGLMTAFKTPFSYLEVAGAPAAPDYRASHCVNVELLLSTPKTVVVRARLGFVAPDGHLGENELALVIPRSRCSGDQPYWPALLSAAQEHWHRCPGCARELLACIDGEWQVVLKAQASH